MVASLLISSRERGLPRSARKDEVDVQSHYKHHYRYLDRSRYTIQSIHKKEVFPFWVITSVVFASYMA